MVSDSGLAVAGAGGAADWVEAMCARQNWERPNESGRSLESGWSLVVAEICQHFSGVFNSLVQAFLHFDITEDDALQCRVPEVGEGNPVSEERWRVEVFGDLRLSNFEASLCPAAHQTEMHRQLHEPRRHRVQPTDRAWTSS